MSESPTFCVNGEPTYLESRRESLPSIAELEDELRRMQHEMAEAEAAQRISFLKTLTAWRARDLGLPPRPLTKYSAAKKGARS